MIIKDNDNDKLIFILRVISGLKTSCDAPSWTIVRDKNGDSIDLELNTTIGDSPATQLKKTKE